MRKWIEILVGMLIVIPITKIVTDELMYAGTTNGTGTYPAGFLYNATTTSVGKDGSFVGLLFQWWWIGWGILLVIMAVYLIRKGLAGGINIFGGGDDNQGGGL